MQIKRRGRREFDKSIAEKLLILILFLFIILLH